MRLRLCDLCGVVIKNKKHHIEKLSDLVTVIKASEPEYEFLYYFDPLCDVCDTCLKQLDELFDYWIEGRRKEVPEISIK